MCNCVCIYKFRTSIVCNDNNFSFICNELYVDSRMNILSIHKDKIKNSHILT